MRRTIREAAQPRPRHRTRPSAPHQRAHHPTRAHNTTQHGPVLPIEPAGAGPPAAAAPAPAEERGGGGARILGGGSSPARFVRACPVPMRVSSASAIRMQTLTRAHPHARFFPAALRAPWVRSYSWHGARAAPSSWQPLHAPAGGRREEQPTWTQPAYVIRAVRCSVGCLEDAQTLRSTDELALHRHRHQTNTQALPARPPGRHGGRDEHDDDGDGTCWLVSSTNPTTHRSSFPSYHLPRFFSPSS